MTLRLWPYFVEPLRARRGSLLLSLAAIALGVALGVAVNAVNRSALAEFSHGMQVVAGAADLEVRGPRAGFDESLYPRLARLPGIALASPALEFDVRAPGREGSLKLVGIDPFRAARLQPQLVAAAGASRRFELLEEDVVYLSPAAARWLGAAVGDVVRLESGLSEVRLTVKGLLAGAGEAQRIAVTDIATAQWRFDRRGVLHRVDLRYGEGMDAAALERDIRSLLPAGVIALAPQEAQGRQARVSRAYRVNLDMLAMVALLTGAFLVFSTQSLAVVRRRSQFAFLRAAGVTRRTLVGWLVAEGALLGAAGALAGVPLGHLLAQAALELVGPDLGAGYFAGLAPRLAADWRSGLLFFLLGVAAAAAGALAPALEAAREAPARALKAGDEARALARLDRAWPGATLLAAGGGLALLPPVDGLPLFGYAGIALLLAGAVLLAPRLARLVFAPLPERGPAAWQLAAAQAKRAPGHAGIAAAGILASVAVAAAMAIMVDSFRESLDAWLDQVLPADLYLRARDLSPLTAAEVESLAATPGIARLRWQRQQNLLLDERQPPVTLLARFVDADGPAGLPMVAGGAPPRAELPVAWISEAVADLYGFRIGEAIALPLAGRRHAFVVAGVWRDYARQHGTIAISLDAYRALTGDARVTDAAVWLAAGEDAQRMAARLRERLGAGERLEIGTPGEIRAVSLRLFDRSFAVTYALEAVAIVIGLAGVAASFGALAAARRREFGMLRHLGMTRAQIGAMLAGEGALTAALGVAAGLLAGGAIGTVLIRVVNRQSFHWSMELALPVGMLAALALAMVALAALVSVVAARRAMQVEAVRAVREDW